MDSPLTEDRLLGGRVVLQQPAGGFRAAIDPILLAAAVPAAAGERVAELGCGTGPAFLCLAARVPLAAIAAFELQEEMAKLARANADANGRGGRTLVAALDIREATADLAGGPCDHVFANPPYMAAGTGSRSPERGRDLAGQEGAAGFADWVAAADRLLCHGGSFTIVHRADRLDELVALMRRRFGAMTVFPLWPRSGQPAKRVLIAGRKGSRAPARLLPGLVLHAADGSFTLEAEAVLRHGEGLPLWPGLAPVAAKAT